MDAFVEVGNMITMTGMLATLSVTTTRRVIEVGLIAGGLVALIRRNTPQQGAPWIWVVLGAILIGVAFGTQLYAVHCGRPRS